MGEYKITQNIEVSGENLKLSVSAAGLDDSNFEVSRMTTVPLCANNALLEDRLDSLWLEVKSYILFDEIDALNKAKYADGSIQVFRISTSVDDDGKIAMEEKNWVQDD